MSPQRIARVRDSGGWLETWRHDSAACRSPMQFSIYLPPGVEERPAPALYWLSGLTCSDENFRVKAGAQRYAAEHGLALVITDTSPRGAGVPDDPEFDLGQGAGFYVDATQPPWSTHYHMLDYVGNELPALVERHFPVAPGRRAISGHSMGGHGALVLALRNPGRYRSVSAFAPICAPCRCPWGEKAFSAYLGGARDAWRGYDATCLVQDGATPLELLVDQGTDDEFLDRQLHPHLLEQACAARGFPLRLRYQAHYDHSYHFVASFIGEHLAYHALALHAP